MNVSKKRPVHLDLTTFKFPITSHASILHRVSGFVLFLVIPVFLWALQDSLKSPEGYQSVVDCLSSPLSKLVTWACVSALAYHLVAGIKHLVMDMGIGETLEGGQLAAKITLGASAVIILLLGVWVW